MRRTTLSADPDDLAILEHEARRRGVSLTHVLREAVMEYAAKLHAARRPSFGIALGDPDLAQASVDDEVAPIVDQARRRAD